MATFEITDFNGAAEYFASTGSDRWAELEYILSGLRPQLQPSGQSGLSGKPIFDPKATNAALTAAAATLGWDKVVVPANLQPFGKDWDSGKGSVLAEWQFSNYPFLWNNIIRTEAVLKAGATLPPLTGPTEALVVVTKSGSLPASNSTLYYEQAEAQIRTVTRLGVFDIPIRLVGLTVPAGTTHIEADWNTYPARYGRLVSQTAVRRFDISWGRPGQYGNQTITFS